MLRLGVVGVSVVLAWATLTFAQAQMVNGDVAAGRRKAEPCAACHGRDGNSTNPTAPSLAGQPPLYTYYQLIQFTLGRRANPQMAPFVASLTDGDMQDLAIYYASVRPASVPGAAPDPRKIAVGERIAMAYHCTSCHRADLSGQNQVPRLTGLSYDYLVTQLRGYKAQTRADIDLAMTMAAQPLTEDDIENLAHFVLSVGRSSTIEQ